MQESHIPNLERLPCISRPGKSNVLYFVQSNVISAGCKSWNIVMETQKTHEMDIRRLCTLTSLYPFGGKDGDR